MQVLMSRQRIIATAEQLLDRPSPWLVTTVSALPLAYLLYLLWMYAVDVPFGDQWELVPLLEAATAGRLTFTDLWRPHNEHRILFPRLLMLGLAMVSGWNTHLERLASVLMACGILGMLAAHFRAPIARSRMSAWAIPVFAVLLFSVTQWENWLWGWQVAVLMNVTAVVGMVLTLSRPRVGWPQVAAAGVLATVATLSFATGTMAWPIGLMGLAWRRSPHRWRYVGAWCVAMAVVGVAFLYDLDRGPGRPSLLANLAWSPGSLWHMGVYVTKYLGAPLSRRPDVAPLLGLGALIGFVGLVWSRLKRTDDGSAMGPTLLALYPVAAGLMTGLGRVGFGTNQAMSSRYITIASLFWVALVALVAERGSVSSAIRGWTMARIGPLMGLACIGLIVARGSYYSEYAFVAWHDRLDAARSALVVGQGADDLRQLYPDPVTLRTRRAALQFLELSVFRHPTPAPKLGETTP